MLKKLARILLPAYRVALRNEQRLEKLESALRSSTASVSLDSSLTADYLFQLVCFANEVHDTHAASFAEFKNCSKGRDVAVVATGPTLNFYSSALLPEAKHIGVNSAFLKEDLRLDYYFTTDYEHRSEWFPQLKDHDFIKFFGQYSNTAYREKYQVTEQLIEENHARRFFQSAPDESIHLNIEYYPLMGFYSVVFQALHFALYTNPARIFLIGCDCTDAGSYNGETAVAGVGDYAVPVWLKGYRKLKDFTERFYPETELISVNPVGLRGMFRDVYTTAYADAHPELDRNTCEWINTIL